MSGLKILVGFIIEDCSNMPKIRKALEDGLSLCGRVKYGIEDGEFFNPLYEHISRDFYKMRAIRVLDIPSLMVEDISEEEYFRDKPAILGLDCYIASFRLNLLGFDSYDRFDFFIFTGGLCNIYPVIYNNDLVTSFSSLLPDFDFNYMLVRTKIKTKDVSSIDLFLRIDNRNKNAYLSSLYNPIIGDFCYNKDLLYFYDIFISFNDFRESAEFKLYEFISDNTIIIGDTSFTYGREFDLILPIGIVRSEFSFLRKDSVCKVVFPPTLTKISLDALNTIDVSFVLSKNSSVSININLGDGYIELKGNSANASFIKELEKLRISIDFY